MRISSFQKSIHFFSLRQRTFYLAMAGIARATYFFKQNSPFLPTDFSYSGLSTNLVSWLIKSPPYGSQGYVEFLKEGGYKIVYETGKDYFYSLGFIGQKPEDNPLLIIKVTFSNIGNFQVIKKEVI